MMMLDLNCNILMHISICLPVWRDRVRRLATDPVVMRSNPATGHNIRYALLANQHK